MKHADEYREALEYFNDFAGEMWTSGHSGKEFYNVYCRYATPAHVINAIRRALRIAEMLEGEPSERMKDIGIEYVCFPDAQTACFKAMVAELIKQVEKGE